MNKITILGSGISTGVPILGCNCHVCQSNDMRNKRLRTSALLTTARGKKILIDTSPDLRTQLLPLGIDHLDAVIITHDHADHTHGMDELRPLTFRRKDPLMVFASHETAQSLTEKFPYIFNRRKAFAEKPIIGGGIPLLDLMVLGEEERLIEAESMRFRFLSHGYVKTLLVQHEKMAYIVDCQEVPETILEELRKLELEVLVIDCLRPDPHETHLHLDLSLEYIERIKPKLALLTHLGHEWDYVELLKELHRRGAKNVIPALDGQSFLYS